MILLHPYDSVKWGFDQMEDVVDDFYLEYVVARLSAFRNVWWSLANEFHLVHGKTDDEWDKEYITHVGIQHEDQIYAGSLVKKFQKPVISFTFPK